MATHKVQTVLDEATGKVTIRHFCTVTIVGLSIVHHEDYPAEGQVVDLKAALEANRKAIEDRATKAALEHAVAVGRLKKGPSPAPAMEFYGEINPQGEVAG
jgi:hypothetical protein